jgi:hypothetical protein
MFVRTTPSLALGQKLDARQRRKRDAVVLTEYGSTDGIPLRWRRTVTRTGSRFFTFLGMRFVHEHA